MGTRRHQKSRIRETKHLSTDADSSTDAIGGWTKNTPKPVFFYTVYDDDDIDDNEDETVYDGDDIDDSIPAQHWQCLPG